MIKNQSRDLNNNFRLIHPLYNNHYLINITNNNKPPAIIITEFWSKLPNILAIDVLAPVLCVVFVFVLFVAGTAVYSGAFGGILAGYCPPSTGPVYGA